MYSFSPEIKFQNLIWNNLLFVSKMNEIFPSHNLISKKLYIFNSNNENKFQTV